MEEKIEKIATVTAELKIVSYEEYCEAVQVIKQYKLQLETDLDKVTKEVNEIDKLTSVNYWTIGQFCWFPRLCNGVKNYFWYELNLNLSWDEKFHISEISKISISKFAKCRNVGIKTVQQLQERCLAEGITLKP